MDLRPYLHYGVAIFRQFAGRVVKIILLVSMICYGTILVAAKFVFLDTDLDFQGQLPCGSNEV